MQLPINIKWIQEGEKTKEELDNIEYLRFNIKNFDDKLEHKLDNYYVFKVIDEDKDSLTGFYGMCIRKDYAAQVKKELETWKAKKN